MTTQSTPALSLPATGRRGFLGRSAGVGLSATAIALLAGRPGLARGADMKNAASDVGLLNAALSLEHEAIAAYELGAGSGLLAKPVLDTAVLFQSHHKAHRDALVGTIEKLGGAPIAARGNDEYARSLNAGSLKTQADVLALAMKLEYGATNAYLSVIPSFGDGALAKVAGRLAADETLHWTVLHGALGLSMPSSALSFGA